MDTRLLNEWLAIPPGDLIARSPLPLRVLDTADEVGRYWAQLMFQEFREAREGGRDVSVIVPMGPDRQYPMLAELVNDAKLPLDHVTFFGMDEWLDLDGHRLPAEHPLSLRGLFDRMFLDRVEPVLRPRLENVIFPSPTDLGRYAEEMRRRGGVDTTYGAFGMAGGVVAFNEPEPTRWTAVSLEQLRQSTTRIVEVGLDTRLLTADGAAGGNIFAVPSRAVTIGLREMLAARRVRMLTDSGARKRMMLRILLFSEPTVEFPVTLFRDHPDLEVIADAAATVCPLPAL